MKSKILFLLVSLTLIFAVVNFWDLIPKLIGSSAYIDIKQEPQLTNKEISSDDNIVTDITKEEELSKIISTGCYEFYGDIRPGNYDENGEVYALQNFLVVNGYLSEVPTGFFGEATKEAVIEFQIKNGIDPVGIVGPITAKLISSELCNSGIENQVNSSPIIKTTPTPNIELTDSNTAHTATQISSTQPINNKVSDIILPYQKTTFEGWLKSWGTMSTSSSEMFLAASPDLEGAQAVLEGTKHLSNYGFTINLTIRQAMVILVSRYVDDNNFLACTFDGRNIELIQVVDGNRQLLNSAYLDESPYTTFFNINLNLTMSVKNKTAGCRMVGKDNNVSSTNISDKLINGGVGVQVWYSAPGVANVLVKSVKIEQI